MADSLSPNYLFVNPDGTIGAAFSGGLQLPLGSSGIAVKNQSIQWIRAADGTAYASVYAFDTTSTILNINNQAVAAGENAAIQIVAKSQPVGSDAELILSIGDGIATFPTALLEADAGTYPSAWIRARAIPGAASLIEAFAQNDNTHSAQLKFLDGAGNSDFVRSALPGTLARVGDPMLMYGSAGTPAVAANTTMNPLLAFGASVAVSADPGGRRAGATYVCRNAGVYLAFASVGFGSSAAGAAALGVINQNSSYALESVIATSAVIAAAGMTHIGLIPCAAGDVLAPHFRLGYASTLSSVGPMGGPPCVFGVVQVA